MYDVCPYQIANTAYTFDVRCSFQEVEKPGGGGGRVHINLGTRPVSSLRFPGRKAGSAIEDVVVTVPFPRAVRTANLTTSTGSVLFDEATKVHVLLGQ